MESKELEQLRSQLQSLEERVKFLEEQRNIRSAAVSSNAHPIRSPDSYNSGVKQQRSDVPVYYVSPKKKRSINVEEIVGKYLVGTIASLLVFIAAVCLVAAFWTLMSNEVKFAVILLTGLGLAGVAYWRTWSARKISVPWSIVLGIGVGLMYIALIAGYVSLHLFGHFAAAITTTVLSVILVFCYKPIKSFFVIVTAYLGSLTAFIFVLSVADGMEAIAVGTMMGVVLSSVMLYIAKKQLHGIHQLVTATLCSLYPILLAVRMSTLRNITDAEELICNLFFTICIYTLVTYVRHVAEDFRWVRPCKNILSEAWLCIGAICVITTLKSSEVFSDAVHLPARITITVFLFLAIFVTTFKISHASTLISGVYLMYTFDYFTGHMTGLGIMSLIVWMTWGVCYLIDLHVHGKQYLLSKSKQIILVLMVTAGCFIGLGVNHAKGVAVNIDKGGSIVPNPNFYDTDARMNSYPLISADTPIVWEYEYYGDDVYYSEDITKCEPQIWYDSYIFTNRTDGKYIIAYSLEMICIILSSLLLVTVRYRQGRNKWARSIKAWCYAVSWLALFLLAAFLVPEVRLLNLRDQLYVVHMNWKTIVAVTVTFAFNIVLYRKGYFREWAEKSGDWRITDRSGIVLTVTNMILYGIGMGTLLSVEMWYEHLILMLVMVAVITKQSYVLLYNFRNNMNWRKFEPPVSLYLGLKYIIFIWVLASSFDVEFGSIIVSVVTMFASLLLIYAGFKVKMKTMRIYGLVVIILMALKIALWDLSASNGLVRVVALGCGGLICLGVSIVYSNLNRQAGITENSTGDRELL